ncbi:MAG: DUF4113 domain-containing protein [candidate division Zixibacteria bacterium]|nr:DUF4113 domain-containing protein [candidate division Zixibacteria bacterium]
MQGWINHVRYAASGIQQRWRMKSSRRSKRCTTRWEELLEAQTIA